MFIEQYFNIFKSGSSILVLIVGIDY